MESTISFATLLKLVLRQYNQDLTSVDASLVTKLDECGAFAKLPALRFIISTAIKSGTVQRFAAAADTAGAQHEVERFLTHTGFRPEAASMFFDALEPLCNRDLPSGSSPAPTQGKTVCHTEAESATATAATSACEPPATYKSPAPPQSAEHHTSAAAHAIESHPSLKHLNAILSVNRENETARGVSIDSPTIIDITPKGMVLTCVLRRTAPMGSGALNCAIFDTADTLRETTPCGVLTVGGPSVLPLKTTIPLPRVFTPGKILLWID